MPSPIADSPFHNLLCRLFVAMVCCLLAASCTSKKIFTEQPDLVVAHSDDLEKLKGVEMMLAVTSEKAASLPNFKLVENIPVPDVPHYRIGPGDIIELIYHINYDTIEESYFLDIQDKISIHFPFHPQFSTTVLVRPDGRVTLPMIGDMYVESLTPMEVAGRLENVYQKYIANPSITVSVEEHSVKIVELKRAITNAARGQSKIAPVTPDGRISFPIIGNMQAEGFTVQELEEVVNTEYRKIAKNLHTTVIMEQINHSQFYILGAVERQGRYPLRVRHNLLDALAEAGGFPKTANLEEIIIFRNDGLERPIAMKVNLTAIYNQNQLQHLTLRPADIIYVPQTKISDFNDLVEQVFTRGLYAIVPFTGSLGATYSLGGVGVRSRDGTTTTQPAPAPTPIPIPIPAN